MNIISLMDDQIQWFQATGILEGMAEVLIFRDGDFIFPVRYIVGRMLGRCRTKSNLLGEYLVNVGPMYYA